MSLYYACFKLYDALMSNLQIYFYDVLCSLYYAFLSFYDHTINIISCELMYVYVRASMRSCVRPDLSDQ